MEIYRDKGNDEYFFKTLEGQDKLQRFHPCLQLNLRNGFFISQTGIHQNMISLDTENETHEFESFIQQYKPIVDEMELIPREI